MFEFRLDIDFLDQGKSLIFLISNVEYEGYASRRWICYISEERKYVDARKK
jgi:hypothetical protein